MFVDVSCPWCHGALETNRRLLDELAADPEVPPLDVQWRFQRLHPMPREGGLTLDEYYRSWDPDDPEKPEQARQEVRDYVRGVGVRVDFTRYDYLHDPLTAHRLLAAVRDDAGEDLPSLWSVARAVFNANFVHGLDISDHAVLRGAVERYGLVLPVRIWELVAREDGHLAETLADHERALEVELDGVPRMVVDGTIVPTWIDIDEVRTRLRAAIAAAAAAGAGAGAATSA
ncbi:MAG: putative Dsb family thioredoxin protein [Thermoleophilia bacterium]|nr:putative Dsb family thioredoxin protein [Thermoleophilia bacterium]